MRERAEEDRGRLRHQQKGEQGESRSQICKLHILIEGEEKVGERKQSLAGEGGGEKNSSS